MGASGTCAGLGVAGRCWDVPRDWLVRGWGPAARWDPEGWVPSVSILKVGAPHAELQSDVVGPVGNLGIGKGGVRSQIPGKTED